MHVRVRCFVVLLFDVVLFVSVFCYRGVGGPCSYSLTALVLSPDLILSLVLTPSLALTLSFALTLFTLSLGWTVGGSDGWTVRRSDGRGGPMDSWWRSKVLFIWCVLPGTEHPYRRGVVITCWVRHSVAYIGQQNGLCSSSFPCSYSLTCFHFTFSYSGMFSRSRKVLRTWIANNRDIINI